jgi:hypothetical protein
MRGKILHAADDALWRRALSGGIEVLKWLVCWLACLLWLCYVYVWYVLTLLLSSLQLFNLKLDTDIYNFNSNHNHTHNKPSPSINMADSPTAPTPLTLNSLRATTSLSYLLFLTTTIFFAIHAPSDAHTPHGRFWTHNRSTPFAQSAIVTSIYWLVLFVLQLSGAYGLAARSERYLTASINVGSHFVANNLLLFGFVMLYVRGWYWISLLLLVVNFFNLTTAYFRYPTSPRLLHIGAVSGPLAWNFAALYWVGATAVHTNYLAARIVANVFIWGWLGYGVFFLVAYKDYTMGIALSWLAFCKFLTNSSSFHFGQHVC